MWAQFLDVLGGKRRRLMFSCGELHCLIVFILFSIVLNWGPHLALDSSQGHIWPKILRQQLHEIDFRLFLGSSRWDRISILANMDLLISSGWGLASTSASSCCLPICLSVVSMSNCHQNKWNIYVKLRPYCSNGPASQIECRPITSQSWYSILRFMSTLLPQNQGPYA